jgi:hypothetical protein
MKKVLLVIIPLLILSIILLPACGISKETYDGVVAEKDAAQKQLTSLQEESKTKYDSAVAEKDAAQKKFDDLKAKVSTLIVAGDTVRGSLTADWGPICALTSQWHRGEEVVWRFRIWDPETGNQLPANPVDLVASKPDPDQLKKLVEGLTATVHLSDGQSFPARFAGHGGTKDAKADYFWAAAWNIPADYPTGTLEDSVTIEWTAGGKTGTSQPFKVSSSMLVIVEK